MPYVHYPKTDGHCMICGAKIKAWRGVYTCKGKTVIEMGEPCFHQQPAPAEKPAPKETK